MRTAHLLTIACLLLLLPAGVARAARDGDAKAPANGDSSADPDEEFLLTVVKERSRMRTEYERKRAERLQLLNMAAAEAVGASSLKDEEAKAEAAAAAIDPEEPDQPGGKYFLIWVVGGGILLALVLRLRMPWLFESGLFRRRKQRAAGPMTVQLKPRADRFE